MIFLIAFLWPFGSGIEAVNCGPYSSNPYSVNCQIVLTDKDPAHAHTLAATFSDGMSTSVTFNGPLYYIRVPTPDNNQGPAIHLQSVQLVGQLTAKKPAS
jgi:hypothetical protein